VIVVTVTLGNAAPTVVFVQVNGAVIGVFRYVIYLR